MQTEYQVSSPETNSPSSDFDLLTDSSLVLSDISQIAANSYIASASFIYPTLPIQSANMAATNSTHSVLNMPIPGTKLAPEKFRGDYTKVKDFYSAL